jgi:hypothetical protein
MAKQTPMETDPELEAMLGADNTVASMPAPAPVIPITVLGQMPTQSGRNLPFYRRGRGRVRDQDTDKAVAAFKRQEQIPVYLACGVDGKDFIEEPCINGVYIRLQTRMLHFVPESFYLSLLNEGKTTPIPSRYEQDALQMRVQDLRITAALSVTEI